MKAILIILYAMLTFNQSQAQDTISLSDFDPINNTNWKGTLTYKDYQSGKLVSVDATMQIEIKNDKIITSVQYTYEPNKNNRSSVKLKENGTYYGDEKVLSNTFENGKRTFVTTYEGRDDGKKATIFITHEFSESTFKITKEVQFEGTTERFVRNTYAYTKL
ncbi:MAG: hypothetical protein AAF901_03170 [Bacteroidota bacterium]